MAKEKLTEKRNTSISIIEPPKCVCIVPIKYFFV